VHGHTADTSLAKRVFFEFVTQIHDKTSLFIKAMVKTDNRCFFLNKQRY